MAIEEVATFVEAAEQGSMAAASRTLGIPTSTVSRRIHRLEEELGVQLVEAHARMFRPTEAGEALLRRSASAIRDIREALHAASDGGNAVRGQLRITAPQDVGASVGMATLLAAFRAAHPGVELLIDLSDRRVDLTAEGVDFAFRIHIHALQAQPSLMVRRLATVSAGLFASPVYVAENGAPGSIEELAGHTFVAPTFGRSWQLTHAVSGDSTELDMDAPVQSTSLSFMAPAACAHMGIAPMPDLIARPFVARGDLVRVLPDWRLAEANLSILWPASRQPAPRRRIFLDFVVTNAAMLTGLHDV